MWSSTIIFIKCTAAYLVCLCEVLALKLGLYFCYPDFG